MSQYTAEDRERWREEIREAKASMSKEEFSVWLSRKMNVVALDSEVPFEVQLAAANDFLDKFLIRIAEGRAAGAPDPVLFTGFLRNACAPERDPKAVGLALVTAIFRLAGPAPEKEN